MRSIVKRGAIDGGSAAPLDPRSQVRGRLQTPPVSVAKQTHGPRPTELIAFAPQRSTLDLITVRHRYNADPRLRLRPLVCQ